MKGATDERRAHGPRYVSLHTQRGTRTISTSAASALHCR